MQLCTHMYLFFVRLFSFIGYYKILTVASCAIQFSSVQSLSHVQLFATPWTTAHQASLSSPTPGVHSNSCPSSQWCHPAISPSVIPFSSCPQSLPASGSFPMSQLFAWGGQSIGVSVWPNSLARSLGGDRISEGSTLSPKHATSAKF